MSSRSDFISRKFAYLYLRFSELIVYSIVWIYSLIFSKKYKSKEIKKIGAYWYYPPDLTGSNLRLGEWKKFFEADGFSYRNLYINKLKEYVDKVENGTWTQKYLYFALNLWRRLPQILKAHKFDTIWIDRGLIPFYPIKSAFLERCLKKVVVKLVVDTTDGGDYQANPKLMEETLKSADEITVGYKYLKEIYSDRFKVTQVFWTIPTDNYIKKTDYIINSIPVIGWMGSPANFDYVKQIYPQLLELRQSHDFVFRYICRENFNDKLQGIKTEHFFYDDNYYKIIASFDIGISPFLKDDLRSKGKIAMKHQEFLLMGIPQVCSPVAISEFVENEVHALIISEKEWLKAVLRLITSQSDREYLGTNSKKLFNQYYNYENQFGKLKKVLTNEDSKEL